jgi:hypothetical protein
MSLFVENMPAELPEGGMRSQPSLLFSRRGNDVHVNLSTHPLGDFRSKRIAEATTALKCSSEEIQKRLDAGEQVPW